MDYSTIKNLCDVKRYKLRFRPFLSSLFLVAMCYLPNSAWATHIVGGDIAYRCLGNNQWEITLNVYRDCFYGANDAPFDDPAWIGVYNQFGQVVRILKPAFVGDDTLTAVLNDPCLVVPPDVCVHTTTYRDTTTLPVINGGYTFAYQRCCRNQTILNIINPLETGATYWIHLSRDAMLQCNSSPVFNDWPPIAICVNKPFTFDHSASDANGDSIVYKLCTPYAGGTLAVPQPLPADPPPYDTLVWVGPLYSNQNVLGLGTPLQINPQTGIMTAFPGLQGQFVVGVCIEEYDPQTGLLRSISRRDFQYNVGVCGEKVASFLAPEAQCDNLTVSFDNQSTNTNSFLWTFSSDDTTFTTTIADPVITFPDSGSYTIRLIAEPGTVCADTMIAPLFLQYNSLTADFRADVFDCDNIALLQITDLSVDPVSPPSQWAWTVTYGTTTLNSTLQNPVFSVPLNITGTINLQVTSQNGCVQTISKPFETGLDNPGVLIRDTLRACEGDVIGLNPDTDPGIAFNYLWSPGTGIDSTAVNPTITVGATTVVYLVTISPDNNICQIIKTVTVIPQPLPELAFTADPECDGLTINFVNSSLNAPNIRWDFGDPTTDADTSLAPSPTYAYPDTGTYLVTLTTTGGFCVDTLTQSVTISEFLLDADFSVSYQDCSTDNVVVQFTDISFNNQNNTTGWLWTFSNGETSTEQNPQLTFTTSTTLDVTLTITDAAGCTSTETRTVAINLVEGIDAQLIDTLQLCFGESVQLTGGNPAYIYNWSPNTGIDDPTSANPVFSPTETTVYTAIISAVGADTCALTHLLTVFVTPDMNLQVSGDGPTCEPNVTLTATTDTPTTITWLDAAGNVIATGVSTLDVLVSGTTTYTVQAEDAFACVQSEVITVSGGPVSVAIPDTVAVCTGELLELTVTNLDPNDVLTYAWSPASAFESGLDSATPNLAEIVGERVVYVTITNQFGCSYTDSVAVAVVDSNLDIDFTAEVQCNGATVAFTNTSTNAFGYVWNFGDGSPLNYEVNPAHTYAQAGNYTVTLSIVYDVSCADQASATLTIEEPQIVADFTFDITACQEDNRQIAFFDASMNTFNNTIGWLWTFSHGTPNTSNLQNPVITVTQSGSLVVTLTIFSANDCSATTTDTLNVQFVEINLADTLILCRGDSVALNPNGNTDYQYTWSPATGLSDPNSDNPIAFPTETTVYTVTVQAFGSDTCSLTTTVTVFVPDSINLDLGVDSVITTCGEDVTLTANTDVQVTVEWISAVSGPLGSGGTITVNPFRMDTITAIATDIYGCTDTASVIINDQGVDVEANVEVDSLIGLCESVPYTVIITNLDNLDALTFNWSSEPPGIFTANGNQATVILQSGTATLSVVITNQFGCTDSLTFKFEVVPFEVTVQDTVVVCFGEPAGLNPEGNTNYTYQWSPPDNLSDPTIANPIYTGNVDATYTVLINDPETGCEITLTVFVDVTDAIGLSVSPGDTTVCSLDSLTLTASSTLNGVTLSWQRPLGSEIGTGGTIVVVPQEGNNTYFVLATDLNGCVDTAQVNVLATDFQPGLDSVIQICGNTPTPINPNGNPNYVYTWSPTTGLNLTNPWNPVATLTEDQTYAVTATDPVTGCMVETEVTVEVYPLINLTTNPSGDTTVCSLDPLTFTASSTLNNVTFTWYSPNLSTVIGMGSTITVTPQLGTNTYFVIATDTNGCSDTSAQINVFAADFQPGLNSPVQICGDAPTPINPNGNPNYEYTWDPTTGLDLTNPWNPIATLNESMTYGVTVTDPTSGCTFEGEVEVQIFPLINVEVTGDTTLCTESSVTLTATSDQAGTIFTWFDNPGLSGTPVGTGPEITVTPQGTVTYYVLANNDFCRDTASVTINAFPINAVLPPEVIICEPVTSTELTVVNLDPLQELTYVWSPANAVTPATGSATVTVNLNLSDDFAVALENQFGCRDTLFSTVIVIDLDGTVTGAAVPDTIILGNSSTITVTGCALCSYEWTVPSGTIVPPTGSIVVATPTAVGLNLYTVTVSLSGCSATVSIPVVVIEGICDEDHIFLPNAFTPNNDGENDVLRLRSIFLDQLSDYELMIYNRWGQEIFRTQNVLDGWDGTFRGEQLAPDVYGFYMRVRCPEGEELIQKGNISLLR